jgi:MerR family transcriptional regulator, heat shock protein HspR
MPLDYQLKTVLEDDNLPQVNVFRNEREGMRMAKELWTVDEVLEFFQVEEDLLCDLEAEEIICPACDQGLPTRRFDMHELEKLRIAKALIEEMDVNLSGVEVILQMRQNMIDMRRQFDAILEDLATQMDRLLERP